LAQMKTWIDGGNIDSDYYSSIYRYPHTVVSSKVLNVPPLEQLEVQTEITEMFDASIEFFEPEEFFSHYNIRNSGLQLFRNWQSDTPQAFEVVYRRTYQFTLSQSGETKLISGIETGDIESGLLLLPESNVAA